MWPEADSKHFRHNKNISWGYKKSIWGSKRPISESYDLNLGILGLFRVCYSLDGPFFCSMSWEMRPEADLKHFRRNKNIFWGSKKAIWGSKRPISESYELNLALWGLFRLGDPFDGLFFWSMSWEMWPEADHQVSPHISSFLVKFYQNRMKRLKVRSKNIGFWPFSTTTPP